MTTYDERLASETVLPLDFKRKYANVYFAYMASEKSFPCKSTVGCHRISTVMSQLVTTWTAEILIVGTAVVMRFTFFPKHHTYSILLGWFCVYVLISQASLAGLVLCVGSNDHIAIEATHTGSAHEVPSQEHQSPCVDIPLAASLVMLRDAPAPVDLDTALPTRASVFVTITHPIQFVEPFVLRHFSPPQTLGDLPIAFLRSTILRI